jgi:hypothetical protein
VPVPPTVIQQLVAGIKTTAIDNVIAFVGQTSAISLQAQISMQTVLANIDPLLNQLVTAAANGDTHAAPDMVYLQAEIAVATADIDLTWLDQGRIAANQMFLAILAGAIKGVVAAVTIVGGIYGPLAGLVVQTVATTAQTAGQAASDSATLAQEKDIQASAPTSS